jgi:hypothetical protein
MTKTHEESATTSIAVIAVLAALAVLGVVVVTVAVIIPLQQAEAAKPPSAGTQCAFTPGFNASQGRCYHP